MKQPLLLALYSPAMGSGKSTVAQHLVDRHGFQLVKFAGALKDMISVLLQEAGYHGDRISRMVNGDLKETSLWLTGPFHYDYADAMLRVIPIPAEIKLSRYELHSSLLYWGKRYWVEGTTSRKLQQSLGTEWGRNEVDPNLWLYIARDEIARHRAAGRPVVVDDLRFPNELVAVRQAFGYPVRIDRPGIEVTVQHGSEGLLDNETMTELPNNSHLADLFALTDKLVEDLR